MVTEGSRVSIQLQSWPTKACSMVVTQGSCVSIQLRSWPTLICRYVGNMVTLYKKLSSEERQFWDLDT